jgi:manganese transport protein
VFHSRGMYNVEAIEDAYKLLSPLVGAAGASTLFAVALLASGQNSSITGTLAGQVVMEGFIHLKVSAWLRRLVTRGVAIVPTVIVVALMGAQGTEKLLILSQVILSIQLSFAVVPLVVFTGSKKHMGEFVNARWVQGLAWCVAVVIAGLNGWLILQTAIQFLPKLG